MPILHNIKHIFWDLDHTIWDYTTNARLTIFELYDRHNIKSLTHHDAAMFHKTYCKHNDLAWEHYRKGIINKAELRQRRFFDTFIELGLIPEGLSDVFETEFVERCPSKGILIEGALKVISHFSTRVDQHIITNGFKETQTIKMHSSGIHPFFKTMTNSEDAGFQKPHPEIFRMAMQSAGAKPENSLMVGDNYEADILGAYSIGMKCVFYNPSGQLVDNQPNEIRSISQLVELICD